MPDAIVELRGVTKRFAAHVAVRDLSLSVPRGVIYGSSARMGRQDDQHPMITTS